MKRWIYERFLPMWAKETLLKDYRLLRRENARLHRKLREREAYIKGMQNVKCKMQNAKCKMPTSVSPYGLPSISRGMLATGKHVDFRFAARSTTPEEKALRDF